MCFKLNLKEQYGDNIKKVLDIDFKNEKANYQFFKYQAISVKEMKKSRFDKIIENIKECKYIN